MPYTPRPSPTLAVLGAINWDTTVFERRFGEPGEEVSVFRVEEGPGGKGANTAVAAAKLLGPGKVALTGAVGEDDLGRELVRGLTGEGVETRGVAFIRGRKTGRAIVVVDEQGRKVIHTLFGANDSLRPVTVPPIPASAKGVVIMDVPTPAALEAARAGRKEGARVFYSPCIRSSLGIPRLSPILRLADCVVLNRGELSRLCSTDRLGDGIRALRLASPRLEIVVTLGPDGCLVVNGVSQTRVRGVRLGSMGLRAVNSTGSGDSFLAAYSSYSILGRPPAEAAGWGNLAGALKASREETRGSPSRSELESKMRTLRRLRRGSPSNRAAWRSRRRSSAGPP